MRNTPYFKFCEPPGKICHHGVAGISCNHFVVVEGGCEVGEGGKARVAIHVHKRDVAKRAMNFLDIKQVTRVTFEIIKETSNALMKLQTFFFR